MAKKIQKTNAIRLVEQQKIAHDVLQYEVDPEHIDGLSVAAKIGHTVDEVFKTLVATAGAQKYFVFVIPVGAELNLKLAAKVVGEKKIDMLPVKELLGLTGYVRGGCSPIGMKKLFPTVIDESARQKPYIIVSAGKIGMQLQLSVDDLARVTNAQIAAITQ
ncbi:MAG: Cys-tRNA(Pro) deacylase [Caryophanon sp.]|nr:Cys-tRNA(Pro) deacylase [Caryophanon sp.]